MRPAPDRQPIVCSRWPVRTASRSCAALTCPEREPPRWRRAVIHYHRIVSGPW